MQLGPMVLTPPIHGLGRVVVPSSRTGSLWIDGEPAGKLAYKAGFTSLISWSGLDIGRDRASPVSHYTAPFEFTGRLVRVTMTLQPQQDLAGGAVGQAEMARQ